MRIAAHINLGALKQNLQQVKRLAPQSQVLAMVKANAYGHGLVECARALDADYLGVATLDEALTLRAQGIAKRIVLMGGIAEAANLPLLAAHQLDMVVYHDLHVELLSQYSGAVSLKVWLKIDTGMHRLGCAVADAERLLRRLEQNRRLQIQAVMTHLAVADERDHPHTAQQFEQFAALTQGWSYPRSVVNSAGILRYPEAHLDIVRPGLMLYGLSPCRDISEADAGLVPVMRFEAKVLNVLDVPVGDAIGYGLDWVALQPSRIAVISAGYGDGYPQYPHHDARVSIHGGLCPIVGRVSMDFMMVDITACQRVAINDQVILWDQAHAVMSPYASLTRVMARVPRIFAGE